MLYGTSVALVFILFFAIKSICFVDSSQVYASQ